MYNPVCYEYKNTTMADNIYSVLRVAGLFRKCTVVHIRFDFLGGLKNPKVGMLLFIDKFAQCLGMPGLLKDELTWPELTGRTDS